MKFWDASAIVPLLVAEPRSRHVRLLATQDVDMIVWWGSRVECASTLARLERAAALDARGAARALDRLGQLAGDWHEIDPSEIVRETAIRFIRVHPLRGRRAPACGRLRCGGAAPAFPRFRHS